VGALEAPSLCSSNGSFVGGGGSPSLACSTDRGLKKNRGPLDFTSVDEVDL
jgi:hypothetical protein